MKKDKNLVKLDFSTNDAAELASKLLSSYVATIPFAYEPVSHLFAAGALFTSQVIAKMGLEIQEFLKSKDALRKSECVLPHRKLYETLKFLHNSPVLDDEFVEALRNLHLLTFAENTANEEVAEIYILLETARKLNGPEVAILLATYRIKNGLYSRDKMQEIQSIANGSLNTNFSSVWARMVAKACGYSLPEYVESRQSNLEDLRLIVPRNHNQFALDGRGNDFQSYNGSRLTDFGNKLAEYIIRGGNLFEDSTIN